MLSGLLQDAVNNGASLGFHSPLAIEDATNYWLKILREIAEDNRLLFIAETDKGIIGSVQLVLAKRQNSLHRAEVQKLMVRTRFRRQGVASLLMRAAEEAARCRNRVLLVLDTRVGEEAEKLYEKFEYFKAGIIPQYTKDREGNYRDTAFFYKLI